MDVILLEDKVLEEKQRSSRTLRFLKSLRLTERSAPRWANLKVPLPLVFVSIVAVPLFLSREQAFVGRKVALKLITIVGDPEQKEEAV